MIPTFGLKVYEQYLHGAWGNGKSKQRRDCDIDEFNQPSAHSSFGRDVQLYRVYGSGFRAGCYGTLVAEYGMPERDLRRSLWVGLLFRYWL